MPFMEIGTVTGGGTGQDGEFVLSLRLKCFRVSAPGAWKDDRADSELSTHGGLLKSQEQRRSPGRVLRE